MNLVNIEILPLSFQELNSEHVCSHLRVKCNDDRHSVFLIWLLFPKPFVMLRKLEKKYIRVIV